MAEFLLYPGPGLDPAVVEFPDLPALLARYRQPYAVSVWNEARGDWDMLDEQVERGAGRR